MLFYFDIEGSELSKITIALVEERVSMLMRAHRNGRHLVVMSRRSSSWIIDNEINLGTHDFSTLRVIRDEITQNGNLHLASSCYVKVSIPGTPFGVVNRGITFPLDYPFFEQVLMKVVLVVEDIENDGELLRLIFKKIQSSYCWNIFDYEASHAGGSRGVAVSKSHIDQHRIVFTLLDSDKRAPSCVSSSYSSLKRLSNDSLWPFFFFNVWPCSELENIFTVRVLETLRSPDSQTCLDHLKLMHGIDLSRNVNPPEQYQYFFDIKNGLHAKEVSKLTDDIVITWLNQKMSQAYLDLASSDIPGFGRNIVSQFRNSHRAQQEFHSVVRSSEWLSVFGEVIKTMMWTFAAAKRQIA